MKLYLFPALAALWLAAGCSKEIPQVRDYQKVYYLTALQRNSDATVFDTLSYEIGKPYRESGQSLGVPSFWGNRNTWNGHRSIQAEVYLASNDPQYRMIFLDDSPLPANGDSTWTEAEIRALFTPKVLKANGASGQAAIWWKFCDIYDVCSQWARSEAAMTQDGEVTIVSVEEQEPFTVDAILAPYSSKGLKVKIRFSGHIATFSPSFIDPVYTGDAQLKDGEAVLYVWF
jgi:hypothetical protein